MVLGCYRKEEETFRCVMTADGDHRTFGGGSYRREKHPQRVWVTVGRMLSENQ